MPTLLSGNRTDAQQHPATAHYQLEGVITAVDAVNGMDTLDRQFESVKQARSQTGCC